MHTEPRFPRFLTPRLELRRLRLGDEPFLASLDSDPVMMQYIHTGALPYEKALRYAQSQVQVAAFRHRAGRWMVISRASGAAVGWVELARLKQRDRDDLQVGYAISRAHWGNGYATEAVARILKYAFTTLEMDRVGAVVRSENGASVAVLRKFGFRRIGRRRDDSLTLCNEYRLMREQWRAR